MPDEDERDDAEGYDPEGLLVQNRRAPQLKRLRIPGAPAEAFTGRLDWQQVRQAGASD